MRKVAQIIITAAVVVAIVATVHWMLAPGPIPAATTAAAGVVALWITRPGQRVAPVVAASVGGLVVGVVMHARSHVVEQRAEPRGEFIRHVIVDAGLGLAIAAVALAASFALWSAVDRRLAKAEAA